MVEATVAGKLLFSGSALTILFSSSGLQNKCSPKPNFKNLSDNDCPHHHVCVLLSSISINVHSNK
jgi:hypothetical protein